MGFLADLTTKLDKLLNFSSSVGLEVHLVKGKFYNNERRHFSLQS
jgi:hypothetical protein